MKKVIDILGTKYTVLFDVPINKDKALEGRCGYCFPKARKIVIADLHMIDSWKDEDEVSIDRQVREVIRHEVIHAFLAESGLWGNASGTDCWPLNEEMVDWLAIQWPKIRKVLEKLGGDEVAQ